LNGIEIQKKMFRSAFLSLFLLLVTAPSMLAENLLSEKETRVYKNEVFSDKIHTVKVRSTTWEFSFPVIELGSDQHLELIFDDLSTGPRNFGYTMVHCDANWSESDLQKQEYLSGMGEGTIRESDPSYNTTFDYTHYRLEIPEEDCMPVISGNYALVVYEADDPDKVILTHRFYVVEKAALITGHVQQVPSGDFSETSQQVVFSLEYSGLPVQDPLRDFFIVIRQNGRDDSSIRNLKPSSVANGKIEFDSQDEGIFSAGNEFRTLDLKSMKYQTENIASIDFQNPYYHVFLKPDKSRNGNPYFSKSDLNGQYFINQEKARNKHIEADYIFVHFTLSEPYPLPEDVYITGELTNWAASPSGKMKFNADKGYYECTLLLKQGLYDYAYCSKDKKTGTANGEVFEGSYYETGNDYEIYVYLHDSRGQHDRLVGYLPLKTGK
jgi:hypothetical protein